MTRIKANACYFSLSSNRLTLSNKISPSNYYYHNAYHTTIVNSWSLSLKKIHLLVKKEKKKRQHIFIIQIIYHHTMNITLLFFNYIYATYVFF